MTENELNGDVYWHTQVGFIKKEDDNNALLLLIYIYLTHLKEVHNDL